MPRFTHSQGFIITEFGAVLTLAESRDLLSLFGEELRAAASSQSREEMQRSHGLAVELIKARLDAQAWWRRQPPMIGQQHRNCRCVIIPKDQSQ